MLRPFFGSHFWDPFLTVFRPILGVIFVTFSGFFRSWGRVGGSSVFEGPPKQNRSFWGARRPRKPPKGSPKGGPKTDPEKYTKKSVFGGPFWHPRGPLGRLLGLSWGTLLLPCRFLALGAQKGRPRSSPRVPKRPPRAAQERPREAQERPRGHQESQREAQDSPREPQDRPKRAQERPKRAQEGPRQAKRAPRETKRGQKSKKRDPKETQRNEEGDTRGQRGGHKREIKKRVARESPSQRETEDPSTSVSRRERPKGNTPETKEREDPSKKLAPALFAKLLLSSFSAFFLCRWPRTKRNEVEARGVQKICGEEQCWTFRRSPQPQKTFNERGWGFLSLARCCVPFSGPIFGTLF